MQVDTYTCAYMLYTHMCMYVYECTGRHTCVCVRAGIRTHVCACVLYTCTSVQVGKRVQKLSPLLDRFTTESSLPFHFILYHHPNFPVVFLFAWFSFSQASTIMLPLPRKIKWKGKKALNCTEYLPLLEKWLLGFWWILDNRMKENKSLDSGGKPDFESWLCLCPFPQR